MHYCGFPQIHNGDQVIHKTLHYTSIRLLQYISRVFADLSSH